MSYSKLKEIETQLWGKLCVHFTANEDVNIIVGINGSGKTSLLSEKMSSGEKQILLILAQFFITAHSHSLGNLRRNDIACHCKRQKRYKQEYKKRKSYERTFNSKIIWSCQRS